METLIVLSAFLLAFANGANDNFKGFATVWGSNALDYRRALVLATAASVAGSIASLVLAGGLIKTFSGKGLVPDAAAADPTFMFAVALGAAATVLLATRVGLPISTTHALVGALAGAGVASGGGVRLEALTHSFLAPLLVSPLLAAALGWGAYRVARTGRRAPDCACVATARELAMNQEGTVALGRTRLSFVVDHVENCPSGPGTVRVTARRGGEQLHLFSAASICFARGVNDTPKLAALLIAGHLMGASVSAVAVGAIMGIGGLVFARHVAETMSRRMARMDAAQGLSANLVTAGLVLFASKWGMPVSTTHVSVGSIAGAGAGGRTLDWGVLRGVLLSWVATLPLAAAFAWTASKLV